MPVNIVIDNKYEQTIHFVFVIGTEMISSFIRSQKPIKLKWDFPIETDHKYIVTIWNADYNYYYYYCIDYYLDFDILI